MKTMYLVTDHSLGGFEVEVFTSSPEEAIRWYHEIYGNLHNEVSASVSLKYN